MLWLPTVDRTVTVRRSPLSPHSHDRDVHDGELVTVLTEKLSFLPSEFIVAYVVATETIDADLRYGFAKTTPKRAPSRAAFVSTEKSCITKMMSTNAIRIEIRSGKRSANSTADAPAFRARGEPLRIVFEDRVGRNFRMTSIKFGSRRTSPPHATRMLSRHAPDCSRLHQPESIGGDLPYAARCLAATTAALG